tara:strand:- start:4010 stop:4477 length:468 start_codon:yes stop_codon:yes gene_type:complete
MKTGRGIKSSFKWTFKSFVNIHEWVGLKNILMMSKGLMVAVKAVFIPQKSERKENYQEAIQRLNLSEHDILERQKAFLRIALTMACFGLICLIYMLYLLFSGLLAAGCLALIVALIVFAYAYRFHFWYFQLKSKKLGCSFNEWLNAKVSGEETQE